MHHLQGNTQKNKFSNLPCKSRNHTAKLLWERAPNSPSCLRSEFNKIENI
jgi:hypothetical protein